MPGRGHIPVRMCLVCRKRSPKAELERFTRSDNDLLIKDETQTATGRGCYVCKESGCREKFLQRCTRSKRGRKK